MSDDNNIIITSAASATQIAGYTSDKAEAHAFAVWCHHQVPMLNIHDAWPAWRSARNWIHPDERVIKHNVE